MKVGIVTGVYGSYDPIRGLPDGHGFDDAVIVTDDPNATGSGWRTLVVPQPGRHPRLAAKLPTMLPWRFTDCDLIVWIDASFEVLDGRWAEFVRFELGRYPFMAFRHPDVRTCYTQEALFCYEWEKYRDWPLLEQVGYYQSQGMPESFGLWACGVLGWDTRQPWARSLGEQWWAQNMAWTIQDQVSLPWVLWRNGWRPGVWSCHQFMNGMLQYHDHERSD